MLPLRAEVRRHWVYRIAEAGRRVLYEGAAKGSSRRSRLSAEEQNREYAVLNYLEWGEAAKVSALRSATGANKALLDGMVRKKWLVREAVAEKRDARRVETVAVLVEGVGGPAHQVSERDWDTSGGRCWRCGRPRSQKRLETRDRMGQEGGRRLPKLNENQLAVMAELAAVRWADAGARAARAAGAAGCAGVDAGDAGEARAGAAGGDGAGVSHVSGLGAGAGKKYAHEHALNEAQTEALGDDCGGDGAGRVSAASAVWGDGVGQDGGVCGGDAAGAGCGQERAAAGAGDWADAGDGGADGGGVWERGGAAALAADAG